MRRYSGIMTLQTTGRHLQNEDALRGLLEAAGLRATSQRVGLAGLLFGGDHRHVVANELYLEAVRAGLGVSLATVYNTLGQFVQVGLLRQVSLDAERTYFDTRVETHGHVYDESTGALTDVSLPELALPDGVDNESVVGIDVVFRVRS